MRDISCEAAPAIRKPLTHRDEEWLLIPFRKEKDSSLRRKQILPPKANFGSHHTGQSLSSRLL